MSAIGARQHSPPACQVEDEEMPAHKIMLSTRSAVFRALLNAPMREGAEGVVTLEDVRAPVFRALLHFIYTDALPEARVPLDSPEISD